jgi:hypothetical protein
VPAEQDQVVLFPLSFPFSLPHDQAHLAALQDFAIPIKSPLKIFDLLGLVDDSWDSVQKDIQDSET